MFRYALPRRGAAVLVATACLSLPLLAQIADQSPIEPAPSGLALQVAEIREAFQIELAQLNARYKQAPDADSAAKIAQQVSLLKLDLEIRLLELQQQELAKSADTSAEATEARQSLSAALEALRELRARQSSDEQPTSQP